MRLRLLFFTVLLGVAMTSCIPTEDLIYLQKKEGAAAGPVSEVMAKPYRLQTNDILRISIKAIDPALVSMFSQSSTQEKLAETGETLYFEGYTVDDHGNIRIPLLGEVNVLGFTTEEVRQKIEKELLESYFTKEANIFVTVKLTGFRFTVNGEVQLPGTKTLYQDKVNVLEAVANAGDITITGDRKQVMVIRQLPQGSEIHEIDLTDVKVMQSPYFYLQPNDYVYIKPLKQKSWGTGRTGIESISTLVTLITLVTTGIILLNK
jgi:polysaccharide biosynthesis/export protein